MTHVVIGEGLNSFTRRVKTLTVVYKLEGFFIFILLERLTGNEKRENSIRLCRLNNRTTRSTPMCDGRVGMVIRMGVCFTVLLMQ